VNALSQHCSLQHWNSREFKPLRDIARFGRPLAPPPVQVEVSAMALRLRYEIENPQRLREHVHLVGAKGYFFFPGTTASEGAQARLEVQFTEVEQSLLLAATIWASSEAGVWLELPNALDLFLSLAADISRDQRRVATEQLVLVEAGGPALLCRLAEVSDGGARLLVSAADVGGVDHPVRVALPEAGPDGAQLQAFGRVAWAGEGEVGVAWNRGDLASRAAVRRLLELAEQEWESARSAAHGPSCRCQKRNAPVLLLG
jgi:hypothetical protein